MLSKKGVRAGADALTPFFLGAPAEIRTRNRLIRSQVLCPLRYGGYCSGIIPKRKLFMKVPISMKYSGPHGYLK